MCDLDILPLKTQSFPLGPRPASSPSATAPGRTSRTGARRSTGSAPPHRPPRPFDVSLWPLRCLPAQSCAARELQQLARWLPRLPDAPDCLVRLSVWPSWPVSCRTGDASGFQLERFPTRRSTPYSSNGRKRVRGEKHYLGRKLEVTCSEVRSKPYAC